jgi:broad specificity phosphatase PhoE
MALGPFYVAQQLRQANRARGLFIFTRHGETAWNREGRVMGRQPVELDERGVAQVRAAVPLARRLKPELILTSPLRRARQTAEIIAAGLDGDIEIIDEPQLEEVRYGKWEGMVYQDLIRDEDYIRYRQDPLARPTPGGETIGDVQARGCQAVNRALEQYPGRRLLFVSHGDIIRTVLCRFMRLELAYFHRIRVDNVSFSAVEASGDFAEIKFLNLLAPDDLGRAFALPFSIK